MKLTLQGNVVATFQFSNIQNNIIRKNNAQFNGIIFNRRGKIL